MKTLHVYLYLFGAALLLHIIPQKTFAQLSAIIQNTATGQENGSIELVFPAGYPIGQLTIKCAPLQADGTCFLEGTECFYLPIEYFQPPAKFINLWPGQYRIILNRNGWCSDLSTDFEVLPCALPMPTLTPTPSCMGTNNGSITLSIANPENYNYQWTGPNGYTSNNQNISGLEPGNYAVSVIDGSNCVIIQTTTLTDTNLTVFEAGTSNGPSGYSVFVYYTGNPVSYTITDTDENIIWYENVPIPIENPFITPSLPQNYSITLTDAQGCNATIIGFHNQNNVPCFTDAQNAFSLTCTPFTSNLYDVFINAVDINNPIWIYANKLTIHNNPVSGSIFTHEITDIATFLEDGASIIIDAITEPLTFKLEGEGCQMIEVNLTCSGSVSIPTSPTPCTSNTQYQAITTPAYYNCNGTLAQAGMAHIVATDGCTLYQVNGSPSPYLNNLSPGNHSATISSSAGTQQIQFSITQETPNFEWTVETDILPAHTPCSYPDEGGRITFTQATLYHPNYGLFSADTWAWSDGVTTNNNIRSGLSAGSYTVTISHNGTGCSTVRTYNIAQPSNYTYHAQITPALTDCMGNILQNGTATIEADSPCPMYYRVTYNGNTYPSGEIPNLAPGNYSVLVHTDFYSSTDPNNNDVLSVTQSLTFSVGTITGVEWVVQPLVTPSAQNCDGDLQTGSISLADAQLIFPDGTLYTPTNYQWGTACPAPCHSATVSNLAAGHYEIILSNAQTGCTYPIEVTVPESIIDYQFMASNITPAYVGCNGNVLIPGSAYISPSVACGAELAYSVIDELQNHTIFNLQPGSNLVTILHSGISETIHVEVPQVSIETGTWKDEATIVPSQHQCNDDLCTGSITIDKVTVYANNYSFFADTYTWADCPTCNQPTRTQLCTGTYTVTVSSSIWGCSQVFSYTVDADLAQSLVCCLESQVYPAYTAQYPDVFSPTRAAYTPASNTSVWTNNDNDFSNLYGFPSSETIALQTDLVIPDGTTLTLNDIEIAFAPHTRILVQRGGNLYLGNNVQLHGLCNAMWQGIQVEGEGQDGNSGGRGTIYASGNNIHITDAIIGISGMNIGAMNSTDIATIYAPLATNPTYSGDIITATPVGSTTTSGGNASSVAMPYLWGEVCRQTAGGLIVAQGISFERCLHGINITWQAADDNIISENQFLSGNLRYPFHQTAQATEAGIYALSVKKVCSNNLSGCSFVQCKYGIRANDVANLYATDNEFSENQVAISVRGFLSAIEDGASIWSNSFENCRIALQADGIDQLQFRNNTINSYGDSESFYGNNGSAGIYARGCNSLLQNNTIRRVRFGIILKESEYEGTFVHGNIIEDTREAILSEGNNKTVNLVCNHLLFYDKAGLDIRANEGLSIGVLAEQGNCNTEQPAANTFMPDNAVDILLGVNTESLTYNDVAADMLTYYRFDATAGQYVPQSAGCADLSLTDYCESLRLTSLSDIDQLPVGSINFDKAIATWLLELWENGDYQDAVSLLHRYGNNTFTPLTDSKLLTRRMIQHKIKQDSLSTAKDLLTQWTSQETSDLMYKQFYNLLADLAEGGRTLWQLTEAEMFLLNSIAQSYTKTAYKAQGLLYEITGHEYIVPLPNLADGTPTYNWHTTFKAANNIQISDIYPNPTQSEAYLSYALPENTTARFALYDLNGRLLQEALLSKNGKHTIAVNNYPAGIYLYEAIDPSNANVLKRGKLLIVK